MDLLPREMVMKIIMYLDLPSVFHFATTSKAWIFDNEDYKDILLHHPSCSSYRFHHNPDRPINYKQLILWICREQYFSVLLKDSYLEYDTIYNVMKKTMTWEEVYNFFKSSPVLNSPYFTIFYLSLSPTSRENVKFKSLILEPINVVYPIICEGNIWERTYVLNMTTKDPLVSDEIYDVLNSLNYEYSISRYMDEYLIIVIGKMKNGIWFQ